MLYLLSHIIFRRREELTVPALTAAAFAFREPVSSGISRYGSVLFLSHEPLFCALLFTSFFLLFFTLGKALCPLTDRFRGWKGGGCGGKGGKHFLSYTGCHPRASSPALCLSRGPSGPVCAVGGHDGYYGASALSAMQFPPLQLCDGAPGLHLEECPRGDSAGRFPCAILRTPVCAAACA